MTSPYAKGSPSVTSASNRGPRTPIREPRSQLSNLFDAAKRLPHYSLPTHGVSARITSWISPSSTSAATPITRMHAMVSGVFISVPDR